MIRRDAIQARPFASDRQRDEETLRGLPVLTGRAFGYLQDLGRAVGGHTLRERLATEYGTVEGARAELMGGVRRQEAELRFEGAGRVNRAEAFRDFQLDRVTAGLDRSTVGGERRFQEESRLLGVRREYTKATRDFAAAERSATAAGADELDARRELAAAERTLAAARLKAARAGRARADQGPLSGAAPYLGGALFGVGGDALARGANLGGRADELVAGEEERVAHRGYLASQDAYQAAVRRSQAAKDDLTRSAAQRLRAESDVAQARAGLTEERAGQAADKDASLTGLGVGGRETAKAGLDILRRFGPEALSPELRAAVQAVAPDTLRKADERYGAANNLKGEFDGLVDKDERGFGRTADVRKQAAGEREQADRLSEQATRVLETGLSAGFDRFIDAMVTVLNKVVDQKVQQVRSDQRLAGLNQQ